MKTVCLVGSTKFKESFERANKEETIKGNIVLSVGLFGHKDPYFIMNSQLKRDLDILHLRKIDLSDEVLVINEGDYIGVGACDEIGYAWANNKPVRYMYPRLGGCK